MINLYRSKTYRVCRQVQDLLGFLDTLHALRHLVFYDVEDVVLGQSHGLAEYGMRRVRSAIQTSN
jgi:hypothetical protein